MSLIYGDRAGGALQMLAGQGIGVPCKPDYDVPAIPRDITGINDEDLMEMYSKFIAYADFLSVQVALSHVDERNCEKRLASLESRLLSFSEKTDRRVTVAKAIAAQDPAILAQKDALEVAYAYRKLIDAMAENIERDSSLVSRELTRRTSNKTPRRATNWSA